MPATNDGLSGDPMIGAHFEVSVGAITGYFTEVSGLGSESEVVDHKIIAKGAKESIIRKIPGRLKWGDITLKRGITANAIAPGFIETDMTAVLDDKLKTELLGRIPLARLGQAEDIADAALFLAGPGAAYITGQVLTVDGGMVM